MEKARDAEAKANLQPPFYVRKIDSKYLKNYCSSVKKEKEDANWEHCNEASSKTKKKLSPITPLLLINLRLRPPKSISKEAV